MISWQIVFGYITVVIMGAILWVAFGPAVEDMRDTFQTNFVATGISSQLSYDTMNIAVGSYQYFIIALPIAAVIGLVVIAIRYKQGGWY